MAKSTFSIKLSEPLMSQIKEFADEEGITRKGEVIRRLLDFGLRKWRQDKALELLRKGSVTLTEGARLAGMDLWEFVDLVKKENVQWVELDSEEIMREIREATE